jgi:hypothetical protein
MVRTEWIRIVLVLQISKIEVKINRNSTVESKTSGRTHPRVC